jgi:hypothetical protein
MLRTCKDESNSVFDLISPSDNFNLKHALPKGRHDIEPNDTQHDDTQNYGLNCDAQHGRR